MKKVKICLMVALVALALSCVFVGCGNKDASTIVEYKIETTNVTVGDEYSSSDIVVTAVLGDKSTKEIGSNLVMKGDDAESLKLDANGLFTTAGEYKVKVYTIEEREDLYIGDWTIKVSN